VNQYKTGFWFFLRMVWGLMQALPVNCTPSHKMLLVNIATDDKYFKVEKEVISMLFSKSQSNYVIFEGFSFSFSETGV
jgi:hypothetical protein